MPKKKLALPPQHHLNRVKKVELGESIVLLEGPNKEPAEYRVEAACDVKDNGRWYCATHGLFAHSNIDKDSHLDERGQHILAWWCATHGRFEVP